MYDLSVERDLFLNKVCHEYISEVNVQNYSF
jgi:hypothetical protein